MKIRRKIASIALCALACTATQAADVFFDFDTNPTNAGSGFIFAGNHVPLAWCSGLVDAPTNGNPATGGYLSIADGNLGGNQLVCVFPDIDGGYPIKAFHLTADVRAGNSGNTDGRPADGFSISYCREGDKVLVNATNGVAGGAAGGDSAAEATNPNGSGDLENGTKSGVAILFDAWAGNWLPDTAPGGLPGGDVEGIEIRVDDHTLRQIDMSANRNGGCYFPTNADCGAAVCGNPNTEQTGPWANDGGFPDSDGTVNGLCWARLDVELTTNKQVTVIWKGSTLVDHYQITNYPNHRGRLVLMGRTGGNQQNAHFDNIHLTTVPAIEATFDHIALGPNLNQWTAVISDNPPSVVTNIVSVTMDGSNVTSSVVVTKNGNINTLTYTQVPFFAARSTHSVTVVWQTSLGQTLSAVNQTFTVPGYLVLPPTYAVSSVDLTKPGFSVAPWQNSSGEPNRNYWADQQLEGLHGTNEIDFTSVNTEAAGVIWDGAIDFANAGAGGQFPLDQPWAYFGIPAPTQANDNNSAVAFSSYLYFPVAGSYYVGGNSDDGVRLTFYKNAKDMLGTGLAPELSFDGGRGIGNNQNVGIIYVSQPGYYGSRLLWYNGGGGSAVEFYTTQTPVSGVTNILVNDTNNPIALRCYRASPVAPAYVSFADPPLDDDQVLANAALHYQITDASTTVSPGGVSLTVNGVVRAPVVTKPAGTNVTDVLFPILPAAWPQGTNTVNLAYTDSAGSNYNHNYYFVVQPYVTLSTNVWTALGSGFNPGFRMASYQTANTNIANGWQNSASFAIQGAEGFYTGNEADLSLFTHNGQYWNSTVINFSQNGSGNITDNGDFRSTDLPIAHPDTNAPGLPGIGVGMDNDAFVAKTFLEFPTAGLYLMIGNSDDSFRVMTGDRRGPGRSMVTILAPASLQGDIAAMDQGQNFGAPLPIPSIIKQAVLCNPPWPTAMPVNASALAGKIAICHRSPAGGTAAHTYWAQQAGAVAVVFVDQDNAQPRQVGLFGSGTPTPTIPIVMIDYTAGTNIEAHATFDGTSPVILALGDGVNKNCGQFSGGRGATDTSFAIQVPVAGVYPMSLYWENGGGDANCEWIVQDTVTGVKTLVNDPACPVKAWIQRTFPSGAHFNPPVLSGGNMVLSWTGEGELEFAYSITGPWWMATSQSNPQNVPVNSGLPGITQTYYRVRSF